MLTTHQFKIYDNMIRRIYSCTDVRKISATVLDHLSFLVPHDSAAVFMVTPGTNSFAAPFFVGLDHMYFKQYQEYYEEKDEYKQKAFARGIIPPVDKSSDYFNYREWTKNEHRVDFLLPQRIYHISCVQIFHLNRLVGMISLHRSPKSPDFSKKEMELLKMLHYHLNNVFEKATIIQTTQVDSKDKVSDIFGLTGREYEISTLISRGKTNKDIARELFISENTVKTYIKRIFVKTEVSSRVELAFLFRL
ncbi:LuxR C-terminal-related transcriptional regulator [Desulfallas thermosapovorans]|uniref:Regulatory LuxR family protein n=1 Tax=Desulfallas thermosapovorans DSM 6562 TaxID=1121431 RepID=A0A5S4ZN33_9FIRM|nr:LuxR C-terminal-related transcriptional regulator [Desulfallas thermosapovorans]TYO89865.1 regulatory LuxR family protein [Desulfallas thermosapovorans DSM 6562]